MKANYRVNRIHTDEDTGEVIAKCYDILYAEDFDKYLGYPDDFDSKENASMLLQDPSYEMTDEVRNDIETTFNVTEFEDDQDFDYDFDYDFDDEEMDELDRKALQMMSNSSNESLNLREALNKLDIETDNYYDLLNLYESCNLNEAEKRKLGKLLYDKEDANVIYDTLNDKFVNGEEIRMSDRDENKVIHESTDSTLQNCLDAWRRLEQHSVSYDEAIDLVTTAEQLVGYYIDRYEEEAYNTYLGNRGILSNVTPKMDKEIIKLFNQITEIDWVGEYVTDPDELEEGAGDNWRDVYSNFLDVVEKNGNNPDKINSEVDALYNEHKGELNWDEAYKRWKDSDKDGMNESFDRNINLDKVVMEVSNLLDDKALGDDWIEVFPTVDAYPIGNDEYSVKLEITGGDDITRKANFRTNNGRVEVMFWNGSEAMCDSPEQIARFIAGEFGLDLNSLEESKIDDWDSTDSLGDDMNDKRVGYSVTVWEDSSNYGKTIGTFDNPDEAKEVADRDYPNSRSVMVRKEEARGRFSGPYCSRENGEWSCVDRKNESKSIRESNEETPYTKEEVERELKSITHNFTDKEGDLKCGFEEEKDFGVEILKQHYNTVEVSGDDRREGTWYHISFAEPIKEVDESLDMNFNDRYFPRVDINDKERYDYVKHNDKDFAYDKQDNMLIYLFQDDDELSELGDKAPWRTLDTVGLHKNSWDDEEERKAYLDNYNDDLDSEASYLANDFIKNELPFYQNNQEKK